jgi:hypothetical protein
LVSFSGERNARGHARLLHAGEIFGLAPRDQCRVVAALDFCSGERFCLDAEKGLVRLWYALGRYRSHNRGWGIFNQAFHDLDGFSVLDKPSGQ